MFPARLTANPPAATCPGLLPRIFGKRPDHASAFWASRHLLPLSFFLLSLSSPAARAQNSPERTEPSLSSAKAAGVNQSISSSELADGTKVGESSTEDPALAPARLSLERGMLKEAEKTTRAYLQAHRNSAEAHFLL